MFLTRQHLLPQPCCISLPASGLHSPSAGMPTQGQRGRSAGGEPCLFCSLYIPSSQNILEVSAKPQELRKYSLNNRMNKIIFIDYNIT